MSLATRCTSCGTIFRVVQDQLKVSDGWVRCGRCDAVFNAASGLFDLEREAPPEWQPPDSNEAAPPAPAEPAAPLAQAFASESERRWFESVGEGDPPETTTLQAPAALERPAAGSEAPRTRSPKAADEIGAGPAIPTDTWSDRNEPDAIAHWAPVEAPPGFVQRARREAFWQSRRSRIVLSGAALLLVVVLVLQGATHFSELAAARLPVLRPALAAWCRAAGCSMAAPHRIDDIVVESTALSAAPALGGLRLAVNLRNRAAYPVAVPSIDFTLTDMTGKMIARRALSPHDFAVSAPAIPASSELSLQAVLTAGATHVSGYTVEIFYP